MIYRPDTMIPMAPECFEMFFCQIAIAGLLLRLQLCATVADKDLTFAEKMFRAYSATARLRVVKSLCETPVVEVN